MSLSGLLPGQGLQPWDKAPFLAAHIISFLWFLIFHLKDSFHLLGLEGPREHLVSPFGWLDGSGSNPKVPKLLLFLRGEAPLRSSVLPGTQHGPGVNV